MIFTTYYAYSQEGFIEKLLTPNRHSYYFNSLVAGNLLK